MAREVAPGFLATSAHALWRSKMLPLEDSVLGLSVAAHASAVQPRWWTAAPLAAAFWPAPPLLQHISAQLGDWQGEPGVNDGVI